MKTGIKTAMTVFFLAVAPVAAHADDSGYRRDDGSSYSSSLPAPDFNWLTLGILALGYSAVMFRRRHAALKVQR